MFNKSIFINLILIFIILYIANQISNNKLLNNVKEFLNLSKVEDTQKNNNNISETISINSFLNSLVNKNSLDYLNTSNFDKPYKVSKNDQSILKKFLENKFQLKKHNIKKIKLEKNLVFYKNNGGFELKPMQITGEYYYNNKFSGNIKLQIEVSFRIDNSASIFIGPTKFNKKSGSFLIHRIFLLNLDKNEKDKNLDKNIKKSQPIIVNKLSESETSELKFEIENIEDNNEIENSEFNSINSLIPDELEFSSEGLSSLASV